MINTLTIFHELQETLDTRAAEKIAEIIGKVYDELLNTVTKDEFRELTQVVQELSEAQKRTEIKVEELAEAQKRTEIKVAELAEAIRQLTVTQQQFARKLDETNEHLGGLTATVGYGLENHAYHSLPQLLQRDFGVTTEGSLHRRFVTDKNGQELEVNIFGAAVQAGKRIQIVGEAKSQLSTRKIDEFIRKKLKRLEGVYPELFPVLVTHMISSAQVADYAAKKGIHLYYSYDLG
jgi:hypothetical protein